MRALVIYSDGRTVLYGGTPAPDDRTDAREVLREASPVHTVEPVRIELPGMPWSVYAADAAVETDDPRWTRNLPASILPTQYGASLVALFGPVVLTGGGRAAVDLRWNDAADAAEDIVRAIHGLPVARSVEWRATVAFAAAVVTDLSRGATFNLPIGG